MTSLEKVEEIVNKLKEENLIVCACLFGSHVIPYIHNANDYDVVVYAKPQMKDLLHSKLKEWYDRKELREQYNIDVHICDETFDITTTVYAFEDRFTTPLCNYEDVMTRVNILDDISKVKESILRVVNPNKSIDESSIYNNKRWYYIYIDCCIMKENSYELTSEEIENINILHDKKEEDLERRKHLIDEMVKEIKTWQN